MDPSSLSYRELQKACKEVGLPARGTADVLRMMLEEYLVDPEAALQNYGRTKTSREGYVDWKNHAAREILWEDLEPGGWLYGMDDEYDAKEVYDAYQSRQLEFEEVPFEQFKEIYNKATKQAAKRRARSAEEEEWLQKDRILHPRQSHNHRGEPVFDMDIEAKEQLREDIKNKLHKRMTPMELWESRDLYAKYKLDRLRPRIYQEIRRGKYLKYLEKKRNKKRNKFAAKNVTFSRN
jgi:hypothetical protein